MICVRDTGNGIPPSAQKELFARYTMLETNRSSGAGPVNSRSGIKTMSHSSGLGLFIAQEMARSLGTAITIQSPWEGAAGPVQGTSAMLVLPISSDKQCIVKKLPPRESPRQKLQLHPALNSSVTLKKRLSVCIVEDDAMNRLLLTTKLKQVAQELGTEIACLEFDSGEAAVQEYKASVAGQDEGWDLILVDQQLQCGMMLGSEAIAELRRLGCRAAVVACSGNCTSNDKQFYIDPGADHCWEKPYPTQQDMARDIMGLLLSPAAEGNGGVI